MTFEFTSKGSATQAARPPSLISWQRALITPWPVTPDQVSLQYEMEVDLKTWDPVFEFPDFFHGGLLVAHRASNNPEQSPAIFRTHGSEEPVIHWIERSSAK